jgi:midasin
MGEDDDIEGQGNRVVSDLTQVHADDSDDDIDMLDKIMEEEQITGISSEEMATSRVRWNKVAGETNNLARRLCEKLRLVMEPLLATKLKGDYRTGKRINMKKVIGYIASGYRKDKIWLRRTKPAKRNYRVLLAVDNSESMDKSGAGDMALAAMATLAVGMSQLEIGELGIASFGDEMKLLHPFHLPFTSENGAGIVHNFPFDEKRTRTALCVESALMAMDTPGDHAAMQLVFMISDGRIERDSRAGLRRLMREMVERNILLVMIVVEGNADEQKRKRDSIVNMKEVTFENGKPKVKQFIEDYPFPYYIILDDMQSLPEVLGDALRQWFEMIAQLQQTR